MISQTLVAHPGMCTDPVRGCHQRRNKPKSCLWRDRLIHRKGDQLGSSLWTEVRPRGAGGGGR